MACIVMSETPVLSLSDDEKKLLKEVAREAIKHGLTHHKYQPIDSEQYPTALQNPGASFVTLKKSGELRGCIGSLEAQRPLIEDVAHNAYAAAFLDHRFEPLDARELADIDLSIAVLTPAKVMQFNGEEDLITQIQPGVDGLILEDGQHRGTFLPAVWESLPDARLFIQQLKVKAGLTVDYWSPTIKISRYTSESF